MNYKISNTLKEKVLKAREYYDNGDPIKDVLNNRDLEDCVFYLSELIKYFEI